MKPIIALFLTFLIYFTAGFSQPNPEKMIDSLILISNMHVARPDSLDIYANTIYALSEDHNYKKGRAFAAKMMGISSFYQNKHDQAAEFHREALELQQALGDSLEVAKAYYNLALSYNAKADIAQTTENALLAIRMFDLLENYNGQGRVYNLLGIASSRNNEYNKAIEYFKSYLTNSMLAEDSLEIASSLNNIGSTYIELGQNDSALHYLYRSEAYYKEMGGHRNMPSIYQNIARLLENEGRIDEAISNLEKAAVLSEQENNPTRLSGVLYNLGRIYRKKNDNRKALELIGRSLELAKEIDDNFQVFNSLQQLAYIKSDQGQFREAYDYLYESTIVKDSIFDVELAASQEELKTIYETEKKEQAIQALNQENLIKSLQLRERNTWLLIAIAALFLLGLGAWLRIRNRNLRAEAKLQRELARKQEEATLAILEAEERERSRIAADLHDGVGQLLSAALLNLNQVHKKVEEGKTPQPDSMENAISLVKDSYNEMREISHQMMPNALLKAGLGYSIREFIGKVDNEQLRISLDIVGMNERLEQQTEILLYRCVQEAVNNVIKHAEADKLSIQLVRDAEGVSVSIEDNGRGFDPGSKQHDEGIGLKNMRSRIDLLKGSLDVDSVVGQGTLLVIFIPLGQ